MPGQSFHFGGEVTAETGGALESRVWDKRRRLQSCVKRAAGSGFSRGNGNRQDKSLRFRGLQGRLSELPWSVWWDCDDGTRRISGCRFDVLGIALVSLVGLRRLTHRHAGSLRKTLGIALVSLVGLRPVTVWVTRIAFIPRNCPGQSGGIGCIPAPKGRRNRAWQFIARKVPKNPPSPEGTQGCGKAFTARAPDGRCDPCVPSGLGGDGVDGIPGIQMPGSIPTPLRG